MLGESPGSQQCQGPRRSAPLTGLSPRLPFAPLPDWSGADFFPDQSKQPTQAELLIESAILLDVEGQVNGYSQQQNQEQGQTGDNRDGPPHRLIFLLGTTLTPLYYPSDRVTQALQTGGTPHRFHSDPILINDDYCNGFDPTAASGATSRAFSCRARLGFAGPTSGAEAKTHGHQRDNGVAFHNYRITDYGLGGEQLLHLDSDALYQVLDLFHDNPPLVPAIPHIPWICLLRTCLPRMIIVSCLL
jgi:hypothetical protein